MTDPGDLEVAPRVDEGAGEQVAGGAERVVVPAGRARWWVRMWRRSALPGWSNAAVILGVMAVTLSQLHPSLLFLNTTATGGDTGAHVALPAFLKSSLLAHGQLTGWDPGWYDGFPLYTFYFPLPGLITVALSYVVPYSVAFKLVTVLGSLLLPLCAWAFGRLAGLRNPIPACLAAATLPFLFEPSFSIYGGNLLSTMAGEFSFSLSLSFALLFLGVVARGLRTGRARGLAAVLFAATLLCHLVPAMFAVAGAVVLLVLDADLGRVFGRSRAVARVTLRRWGRRVWWGVVVGVVGVGLCAWWLVPFGLEQAYTTNMGYTKVFGYPHLLFPESFWWALAMAGVGVVAMVIRRNKMALWLVVMAGLSAVAVMVDPPGKLYNVRFLPFWFLCIYLLAGYAFGEVVAGSARLVRRERLRAWVGEAKRDLVAGSESWEPGRRITLRRRPSPSGAAGAAWGPLLALLATCVAVVPALIVQPGALASIGVHVGSNQPSAWAAWNYSGYERKTSYPEFHAVVSMMQTVGDQHGCGRAMWEYDPSLNRFGTTESLMTLPMFTNGCIGSQEGLLFESSSTTPFHFINQDELSPSSSRAVVGLPYGGLNVPLGIKHLQQMGVRYFLTSSTEVQKAVAADGSATLVASTGPWAASYNGQELSTTWKVYRIADSELVAPLANQPVVWEGVGAGQSSWLAPAAAWYNDPSRWNVVAASDGPANWARVEVGDPHPPVKANPPVVVSNVHQSDQSVTFHVDRVGVPVEVRVSYFPNWHASGASGPYRVTPNLMVVVPTTHDVTLTYGRSSADTLGQALTLGAIVAVVALAVLDRRRRRGRARAVAWGSDAAPPPSTQGAAQ